MTSTKTVRRAAAALVVPLLLASAAACGSGDDETTPGGVPAVSGDSGKKPEVADGKGDPPKELKSKVLNKGDGAKVAKFDLLRVNYLGQTWKGEEFDNSFDKKQPFDFQINTDGVIKGWDEGLLGKTVGSRVELVIPPEKAYGDNPPQGSAIKPGDTLVFVIEIEEAKSGIPEGEKVPQEDAALPKVGTNTDGKAPKITVPKDTEVPGEVVSETVIQGTGKKVGAKDTIEAHFTAVTWKDGKLVGDTRQATQQGPAGPRPMPVEQVPGWAEGLKGQQVGSRVLLVVPEKEFPKEDRKQLGGGLVFAVDILDIQ
ncbi:FKBP-type peptidyl-prolyl cis-trans isomerase [Streptomyces gobiensis]|uniref:FKBP-type peptidyl-prolyl cis-trans isomerase n=1 Tax=Streptomyces gobiensis TaxID=2875706 RepID=UPI001E397160|nr:FKBP-type peptidyl-prolyl cis-trans isomerase [Streptomyces gobiensis]UGY90488.1 FKBP-type peptidyl-prolyl cis-trans isomerase [Streptomyces gobiensis]